MKEKKSKLRVDQEVIYHDGETLIEITKVVEINKANKTAKLANKVLVSRISSTDKFDRVDGKKGYALEMSKKNQKEFEQYKAYFWCKRKLESISSSLSKANAIKLKEILEQW